MGDEASCVLLSRVRCVACLVVVVVVMVVMVQDGTSRKELFAVIKAWIGCATSGLQRL
jgi:hypothetical protein